jgi:surfeit locus 1 family protein
MFQFRPFPALTAACAVLFAGLIALGVWQLERLQWKLALIAQVDRNLRGTLLSLDDRGTLPRNGPTEYQRVALTGHFDNAKEAYIFGTDTNGAPAYHVIVPFTMDDGRAFLLDRGIVPKEKLDPATRRAGQIESIVHIVGVWRTPDRPGMFTPAPDLSHRIWYSHDLEAIARADSINLLAPAIIEADATPNKGGWPRGGQTVVKFRNEHLQYAITWFGLAAVLFGVYVAYHVSRGRLGFRR